MNIQYNKQRCRKWVYQQQANGRWMSHPLLIPTKGLDADVIYDIGIFAFFKIRRDEYVKNIKAATKTLALLLCLSFSLIGCTEPSLLPHDNYQIKQTHLPNQGTNYLVCQDCVHYTVLNEHTLLVTHHRRKKK